ncbi:MULTISPECIES: hypothetical protein [unclassified Pseudomonas]|uniref:hypothetical protein n=1 Tax=unclassified Pseudomonas TaxID=196821 RepID=UPI0007DD630C|nr:MULTISPECIES: hypothetical protein [unclassified Pseudomonas]ANI55054.1 hypothetical protein PDR5_33240 [Pseudomonas sp. DR 5-09]
MKANKAMESLLADLPLVVIEGELERIARSDFVERDGCIFIAALNPQSHMSLDSFPDRTGYECFVNSVHIDDYVSDDLLATAISWLSLVLDQWNKFGLPGVLQGSVSTDEFGATVKVHVLRPDEPWLGDDLEGYEQAVLTVNSGDMGFLAQ